MKTDEAKTEIKQTYLEFASALHALLNVAFKKEFGL